MHPANGSATTNGSYVDHRDRDDGDSDGKDDLDDDHDEGRSSPAAPTTETIDPTLEAGGTSDVRGDREVPPPLEQGRVADADTQPEKDENEIRG